MKPPRRYLDALLQGLLYGKLCLLVPPFILLGAVGFYYANRLPETPPAYNSSEHRAAIAYLQRTFPAHWDEDAVWAYVPVEGPEDFPAAVETLRRRFRSGRRHSRRPLKIVVGGPGATAIDKPLRASAYWVYHWTRIPGLSGIRPIEIIVPSPATVSLETDTYLQEQGLDLRRAQGPKGER